MDRLNAITSPRYKLVYRADTSNEMSIRGRRASRGGGGGSVWVSGAPLHALSETLLIIDPTPRDEDGGTTTTTKKTAPEPWSRCELLPPRHGRWKTMFPLLCDPNFRAARRRGGGAWSRGGAHGNHVSTAAAFHNILKSGDRRVEGRRGTAGNGVCRRRNVGKRDPVVLRRS